MHDAPALGATAAGGVACSSCGASNRVGRRFCTRCGSALREDCLHCGAALDAGDAFCGSCGKPVAGRDDTGALAAGAPGPSTERRIVSVLFADLVGFTSYSEGRDPEEVRETLSRYFEAAHEIVTRYDGVIEKFIGDAVMAVWGTPVAREDDTERSVRAGLDMVDAIEAIGRSIGAELRGRVGIYSGEAAVNLNAAHQGMVAGDMVNTAARLQGVAHPGTVLVDRTTFFGANDSIAFEGAGTFELKGKQDTVEAWRALRVVAGRRGFGTGAMLEPPFTGRQEELRSIKDMLHATGRERRPRLAALVGIAGIGKSRLVWELYKYVDGLSEEVLWHSGRSPAYGEGVAFWPLAEMVRTRAGAAESDDPETARGKVSECVSRYVGDPEERRWIEPRLMQLLGLEDREDEPREVLFAAWRTFFERLADTDTCVMVFEDLQWADGGLIDFIEHLVEWARSSPIFVLTLARPELHDRRPAWGSRSRHFSSIHFEPLNDDDMQILLKGLAPALPEAVAAQIVARAEGIPLYAVEMVRMLIDRGDLAEADGVYAPTRPITDVDVPETLHSLIAARLDVLPEADRRIVQYASILGKTFAAPGLVALLEAPEDLEPRLRELVRREIFTFDTDPRSPERGQYGFVQSLIREVAYQTMANADRRRLHLRAAEYFTSLDDPELVDVIATHYVEANRAAPDRAIAEKACGALLHAADRAASLGSPEQARTLLEIAIEISAPGPDRGRLRHRAGELASNVGQTEIAMQHFRGSLEDLQGDLEATTQVQISMGVAYFLAGQLDPGRELLEGALAQIEDPASEPMAADIYSQLARLYAFQGHWDLADEHCGLALVAGEFHERVITVVDALITRGVLGIFGGRPHEAEALLQGGLKLAQKLELPSHQTRAYINLSANQMETDPRDAMTSARAGLELARRYGFRDGEAFLLTNAGDAALHLAQFEWIEPMEEFLGIDVAVSARLGLVAVLVALHAFMGEVERSRVHLQDAERLEGSTSNLQDTMAVAQAKATIALAENRPEDAWTHAVAEVTDVPVGFKLPGDVFMAAGRAALWLRDIDRMRELLASMQESAMRGPMFSRRRATVESGLAALEGRDDAPHLYLDVEQRWEASGLTLDLALCRLDMAIALRGVEEGQRAAEQAAAFFERSGCSTLAAAARQAAS